MVACCPWSQRYKGSTPGMRQIDFAFKSTSILKLIFAKAIKDIWRIFFN
jgi:hypothetical protein